MGGKVKHSLQIYKGGGGAGGGLQFLLEARKTSLQIYKIWATKKYSLLGFFQPNLQSTESQANSSPQSKQTSEQPLLSANLYLHNQ